MNTTMNTTKKRKNNSSNILIAIMFIIIILLLIYIIFFTGGNKNTDFYSEMVKFQNIVSNYIGNTQAEMFGAYDIENIIIGCNSDGAEIKDIDENILTPLADKNSVIEKNEKKYYKLSDENVKKILNISIPVYEGIDWYICQDGTLSVKFKGTSPKWWNDNLDSLKVS